MQGVMGTPYQVHRARGLLSAVVGELRSAVGGLDEDLLGAGLRGVSLQVVQGLDCDGGVRRREDGVGEVTGVRHVVHAQIEPDNAGKC